MLVLSLTGRALIVRTDDRLPLVVLVILLVIVICLSSFRVLLTSGLEPSTVHDKSSPVPSQVKFTNDHRGTDCDEFGLNSISIEIASAKLHYVSLLTNCISSFNCSTYGKKENTSIKKVNTHDISKQSAPNKVIKNRIEVI